MYTTITQLAVFLPVSPLQTQMTLSIISDVYATSIKMLCEKIKLDCECRDLAVRLLTSQVRI